MLLYHEDLRMFEYRAGNSNLFAYSLPAAIKQTAEIYNFNLLTLLN
jgi:hypothetical protein